MLRERALSALVLIPLVIGALVLGGWWYLGFVGLVLAAAAWEFVQLMRKGGHNGWYPLTLLFAWLPLLALVFPEQDLFGPGVAFLLLASLAWAMWNFARGAADPAADWALLVLAGLYVGWMGAHFFRLRQLPDGLAWSLTAFGSTWLADSGAYFIGRTWGKHKLAPKLSPGKTWEGIVGGVVSGAALTALLGYLFGVGVWHGVVLGILIAVISPIGDLGVSMLKRQVGAKDSAKLIPGHGGVLDRIDSLIISATIATYYVLWLV
jgi:phosphatidate cytidylyltransferase